MNTTYIYIYIYIFFFFNVIKPGQSVLVRAFTLALGYDKCKL